MKLHGKFLGFGIATVLSAGLVAAPAFASAQSYRHRSSTSSEDSARTNALALGAAGLLLLNNHQQTLGTIALGAAALQGIQMQNDISNRHDRESRYGYYQPRGFYNDGGWYDQLGMYHKPGYDAGYYGQKNRYDGDHDRDDRDRDRGRGRGHNDRGRDWASTRGNKTGWDHNGKR